MAIGSGRKNDEPPRHEEHQEALGLRALSGYPTIYKKIDWSNVLAASRPLPDQDPLGALCGLVV
jgi:hypothetical protein